LIHKKKTKKRPKMVKKKLTTLESFLNPKKQKN